MQLLVDIGERAGHGHAAMHREGQAHGVAGGGVGVLPDDKNLNLAHRAAESVEDITGRREGSVAGGMLGAQEIPHGVNLLFDRGEGRGPVLAHDGVQGLVQAYSSGWGGLAGFGAGRAFASPLD